MERKKERKKEKKGGTSVTRLFLKQTKDFYQIHSTLLDECFHCNSQCRKLMKLVTQAILKVME